MGLLGPFWEEGSWLVDEDRWEELLLSKR